MNSLRVDDPVGFIGVVGQSQVVALATGYLGERLASEPVTSS